MIIFTEQDAHAVASRVRLRRNYVVGIDCETVGINPRKQPAAGPHGRVVCWSIAWDDYVSVIWHNDATADVFRILLQTLPVVGHNIYGFDAHMFRKSGLPLGNIVADTLRMSQLLNPDDDAEHGLKALIKYRLSMKPVGSFEELFSQRECLGEVEHEEKRGKRKVGEHTGVPTLVAGRASRLGSGRDGIPLDRIPELYPDLVAVLEQYAALDAAAALKLYGIFMEELKERPWTPPLSQHSGIEPVRLFPAWSGPERPSTSNAVRPRTPGQPPINQRL